VGVFQGEQQGEKEAKEFKSINTGVKEKKTIFYSYGKNPIWLRRKRGQE